MAYIKKIDDFLKTVEDYDTKQREEIKTIIQEKMAEGNDFVFISSSPKDPFVFFKKEPNIKCQVITENNKVYNIINDIEWLLDFFPGGYYRTAESYDNNFIFLFTANEYLEYLNYYNNEFIGEAEYEEKLNADDPEYNIQETLSRNPYPQLLHDAQYYFNEKKGFVIFDEQNQNAIFLDTELVSHLLMEIEQHVQAQSVLQIKSIEFYPQEEQENEPGMQL